MASRSPEAQRYVAPCSLGFLVLEVLSPLQNSVSLGRGGGTAPRKCVQNHLLFALPWALTHGSPIVRTTLSSPLFAYLTDFFQKSVSSLRSDLSLDPQGREHAAAREEAQKPL